MNAIRRLFRPSQPSIAYSSLNNVCYEEAKPTEVLRDYIYCYWQLRTKQPLPSPFQYRVVSDGCIDILFEQSKKQDLYITGFSTQYVEYDLGKSFDYIGVRFLPAGFSAVYNVSASVLTDSFVPLESISPELAKGISELTPQCQDLPRASAAFDRFFSKSIEQRPAPVNIDSRLLTAMELIMEARGGINLADLDAGLSLRQLRRLFEFYFGESPKTFAKIIRFQNILGARPSLESLKQNKIFFDEGYYDQAHFIKEFKQFYGVTPGKAFGW